MEKLDEIIKNDIYLSASIDSCHGASNDMNLLRGEFYDHNERDCMPDCQCDCAFDYERDYAGDCDL